MSSRLNANITKIAVIPGWMPLRRLARMACLSAICVGGYATTQQAEADLTAKWSVSAWTGGYTANLVVSNSSGAAVNGWIAQFTTPQIETSVWNATTSGSAKNVYTLTPASWTATIPAKGSVTIGFTFNGTPPQTPSSLTINGQSVAINGAGGGGTSGGGSSGSGSGSTGTGTGTGTGSTGTGGGSTGTGSGGSTGSGSTPIMGSSLTSGTINFHYYYGAQPTTAEDSLTLTGDNYTDLIMSNLIAGVMYGHLLQEATPGLQFQKDYLYGSIFGQLLQENIATEYYKASSSLIDPSSDQQAVMSVGQGGPYQINNYAADMVGGTYAPAGFSLINYVAIQKNIGFSMAQAGAQFEKATPASFNNKYYGPMLTAFFHFNDYRALQYVGGANLTTPWSPAGSDWTPSWQPYFYQSIAAFKGLPNNQLDIVLNVAYNAGYYASLFTTDVKASAKSTLSTVASFNNFNMAWGQDSYHQYPYQVRGYLDQLYDIASPSPANLSTTLTFTNHVGFKMSDLSTVFGSVFQTLAYVDATGKYNSITSAQATTAFNAALAAQALKTTDTLDLGNTTNRAQIFAVLGTAISNLEKNLNTSFSATTSAQL